MVTFAIMIVTPILAQKTTIERLLEFGMVAQRGAGALLRAAEDFGRERDHTASDSEPADRKLDARLEHGDVRRRDSGLGAWKFSRKTF